MLTWLLRVALAAGWVALPFAAGLLLLAAAGLARLARLAWRRLR